MEVADPVPEDVAIRLLLEASEKLASDVDDERVAGWEIIDDLCNGRPEHVKRSWEVARGRLNREDDPEVVESAVYALGRMASNDYEREHVIPEAREFLLMQADATSSDVRLAVSRELPWFLGIAEDARVLSALIDLTRDPEDEIRDWATFGLGVLTDVDTADLRVALVDRLADDHEDTRDEAMIGLARRSDPAVKDTILAALGPGSVSNLAVESAALLADDDFLPLLIELRAWWDVDPELLERAISRCDPAQRAAAEAVFQRVQDGIRKEFDRSPLHLIGVGADDDLGALDPLLRVEWEDITGNVQVSFFSLDHVLQRDDVRGDVDVAARRMVEMLDANSSPPITKLSSE
jgi:HEAT repeat protein